MLIYESNDDEIDWQTMLWEVTKDARKLYDGISTLCLSYTEKQDAIAEVAEITYDDPAMMIEHIKNGGKGVFVRFQDFGLIAVN